MFFVSKFKRKSFFHDSCVLEFLSCLSRGSSAGEMRIRILRSWGSARCSNENFQCFWDKDGSKKVSFFTNIFEEDFNIPENTSLCTFIEHLIQVYPQIEPARDELEIQLVTAESITCVDADSETILYSGVELLMTDWTLYVYLFAIEIKNILAGLCCINNSWFEHIGVL